MRKYLSSMKHIIVLFVSPLFLIAHAATIESIFTITHQCNSIVTIKAQTGITQQQLSTSCNEMTEVDSTFHNFFNTTENTSALPNDYNDTLDVYIFLTKDQYTTHGGNLFNISTDNGGMYLEGTPSDPNNQAKFIAHICEESWIPYSCAYSGQVYNLKHEYTHYLDSRYIKAGDFSQYTLNSALTEGLAEYIAHGTGYTRPVTDIEGIVVPPLYNVLITGYSGQDRLYNWGYMAIRYMAELHRGEYNLIISALQSGDNNNLVDTLEGVASRIGGGFTPYVTGFTDAIAATNVALPSNNSFGSCALEQPYIRDIDNTATSSINVTNNSDKSLRLLWINNYTGTRGSTEITKLTPGQSYSNNFWRNDDRFMVVTENRECLGAGIIQTSSSYNITQSMVAGIVDDPIPAQNTLGSCVMNRAYFRPDAPATASVSITNTTNTPARLYWIDPATGLPGTSEYARLMANQNYSNSSWTQGDRMVLLSDNRECIAVASLNAGTNSYSVSSSHVSQIIADDLPAANEIGSCSLERPYFKNSTVTNVSITNNSSETMSIRWVNHVTGIRSDTVYATLSSGQNYTSNGQWKDGDRMIIVDQSNQCKGVTSLIQNSNSYTIVDGGSSSNTAPIANSNGSYSGTKNTAVSFSSTGSYDSDGSIAAYSWNFGDGSTSTQANPSHSFSSAGSFNISLTVTDNEGATATSNTTATISEGSSGGNTSVPDACSTENPITGGSLTADDAACLGNSSTIWLSVPNVSGHDSITIMTGNGSGDLKLEYSNVGWPNGSNNDGTSDNAGNGECIHVTGGSNYWGNIKVTNSSGSASILVEFDGAGCGGSSGGSSLIDACLTESPYTNSSLTPNEAVCSPNGSYSTSTQYYYFLVPAGTSSIVITSGHGSGNGDLYYRQASWATSSDYDQRSINSDNEETITISNPTSGYHYISVVGARNDMTVKVELQ